METATPTPLRVIGYCRGANTAGGVDFYVVKGSKVCAYTIPYCRGGMPGALPYEQPSVFYEVLLAPPHEDSYARVLRIFTCKRRVSILERDELVAHLQRGVQAPPENFDLRKVIKDKCEAALPETITSASDYSEARFGKQKWLSSRVEETVRAALLSDTSGFFGLLRYFPGEWLLRFSETQQQAMFLLLRQCPPAFLFWERAVRWLSQTELFDEGALRELRMRDRWTRWVTFKGNRQQLMGDTGSHLQFDAAVPMLSLGKLRFVCEDLHGAGSPWRDLVSPALRQALLLYLEGELNFARRGSTLLATTPLYERSQGELALQLQHEHKAEARRLLCDHAPWSPLRPAVGSPAGLQRPDRMAQELRLVQAMRSCVRRLRIVVSGLYDSLYAKRLHEEVLGGTSSQRRRLVVTANTSYLHWLRRMSQGTDVMLYTLEAVLEANRNIPAAPQPPGGSSEGEPSLLVVDRAHKFSSEQLAALLECCQRMGGGVELVLMGDLMEHPCSPLRGGGQLLADFCLAFPFAVEEWEPANEHTTPARRLRLLTPAELDGARLYNDVRSDNTSGLNITPYDPTENQSWHQIIKQRTETQKRLVKQNLQPQTVQIFCTSDYGRMKLLDKLAKVTPATMDYSFTIKSRVHLVEPDEWGTIEHAAQYSGGYRGTWQQGKKMDLRHDIYQVKVNGKVYDTQSTTLEHTDVVVLSRYTGPQVGYGMIFLDDVRFCSSVDLLGMLKYCVHGVRVYVRRDQNVSNVLSDRRPHVETGLAPLLKHCIES